MDKEYVVIVDSMADFPIGFEHPDIRIVKTPVTIGTEDLTYADVDTFYNKQREGGICKTAAPITAEIEQEMRKILESGKDAVYIATASSLTSAFQSGRTACIIIDEDEGYKNRAIAIDGLSMSVLTAVLVKAAISRTTTTDELINFIFDRRNDTEHFFAVEEWSAFKNSGRISRGTLLLADLIGIKPLMRFDFLESGERKAFCEKKGQNLKALCIHAAKTLSRTIDPEFKTATIVHAQNEEGAKMLADVVRKFAPGVLIAGDPEVDKNFRMGQATGVHLGFSAIGLAFLRRKGVYPNAEKHREIQKLSEAKFEI